ncbi:MAG: UDP-N-acetylmuramate dehydrogenase [Patescibacteria group bacterium]
MATMQEGVSLKPYTYLKVGGPARFLVDVKNEADLASAISFAKKQKIPFIVLGAASNIVVADSGFPGLVIRMQMRGIERKENTLRAEAGVPNAVLVARAVAEGLSGLEWAIGIPGTVGGSVRGNAGCFGGEVKGALQTVRVFNTDTGKTAEHDNDFCHFAYRESIFKKHPNFIVVSATFVLRPGDPEVSQRMVRHYTAGRSASQDIGESSAGCMFKNIAWPTSDAQRKHLLYLLPQLAEFTQFPTIPAGFLIDHLGLKGRAIGGVSISKKHGNYMINRGNARAEEVVMLVGLVKEYVHRKYDLHLQEEVQYIGF